MSNLLTLTSCHNIRNKEACLCTSLSPDFPSGVVLWGEKEEVDVLSKTGHVIYFLHVFATTSQIIKHVYSFIC